MINYTGFEWLMIDLCSHFGHDKWQYPKRIEWTKELLPLFKVSTVELLKSNLAPWIAVADNKPHFTGSALAIWDTIQGEASNWTVAQDSASSGAQLMSCLMKCETGMYNTGVLGTDFPDLYTTVNEKLSNGGLDIPRKLLKKGMIPHMYASTAAPEAIFGDNYPMFLTAYAQSVPMAQLLSDALVNAWNSAATEHCWELPDGFDVRVPVLVTEEKQIPYKEHKFAYRFQRIGTKEKGKAAGTKSLSPNVIHSYDAYVLRELARRCNYDVSVLGAALEALWEMPAGKVDIESATALKRCEQRFKKYGQVSLVAVEHINAGSVRYISDEYRNTLIELINEVMDHTSFEIKTVHDEFSCLPNHVTKMKQHYNRILQETYLGKWMYVVLERLSGRTLVAPKVDQDIAQQILNAPFSIG